MKARFPKGDGIHTIRVSAPSLGVDGVFEVTSHSFEIASRTCEIGIAIAENRYTWDPATEEKPLPVKLVDIPKPSKVIPPPTGVSLTQVPVRVSGDTYGGKLRLTVASVVRRDLTLQAQVAKGAARSYTLSGDFFRFGYVEGAGSSAFQILVDGKAAVTVPAGTALGRRVITWGGFGAGNHTLVVRRAAGATGSLWISGVGVSDSGGLSPEVADFASAIDHPAGTFVAGGVQTLVAALEGGKRMGGGHGGTWSRSPAMLTLDGLRLALEDTAGGYYAGREIVLTESFEMRQDAASAPIALVTRKMIFSGNGYSVDMDIRLPAPVQFRDFFWGMAKAGSAMTKVALPLSAPLSVLPIATQSQLVAFEGNGLRVEVDADGQIKSDGPDQYTYVADNEGVGKLYSVAAVAAPVRFAGRQRLRYSVRFMA